MYGYKVSKQEAEKQFNKLKEADKIKCFLEVPYYLQNLQKSGVAQIYLERYISKRRFDDERPEIKTGHKVGKVFNNVLQDLAKNKTEK